MFPRFTVFDVEDGGFTHPVPPSQFPIGMLVVFDYFLNLFFGELGRPDLVSFGLSVPSHGVLDVVVLGS